jgi:hypothetical protein
MRVSLSLVSLLAIGVWACSSGSTRTSGSTLSGSSSGSGSGGGSTECAAGSPLAGASYDIAKSRFAFGSKPVPQDARRFVRWVGSDGVVAISANGAELGIMNANAPESNLPDWSTDSAKLTAHVEAYWASMGVESCQVQDTGIDGSVSGGGSVDGGSFQMPGPSTVVLGRGVDGVPVVESLANAIVNVTDQSTSERFYWPEIPAQVVTTAIAFRDQLASAQGLAAFKAKLPADAQGQGRVVIHHSSAFSMAPFQAAAVYDVVQTTPLNDGGNLYFDQSGNPVMTVW